VVDYAVLGAVRRAAQRRAPRSVSWAAVASSARGIPSAMARCSEVDSARSRCLLPAREPPTASRAPWHAVFRHAVPQRHKRAISTPTSFTGSPSNDVDLPFHRDEPEDHGSGRSPCCAPATKVTKGAPARTSEARSGPVPPHAVPAAGWFESPPQIARLSVSPIGSIGAARAPRCSDSEGRECAGEWEPSEGGPRGPADSCGRHGAPPAAGPAGPQGCVSCTAC
jgi:hypothetical protein